MNRWQTYLVIASTAAVAFALAATADVATHNDLAPKLKAAVAASQHNRASFRYLSCWFQVTIGQAENRTAAIAGKIQRPTTANHRWVVDGDDVVFHVESDPKLERQGKREALSGGRRFKMSVAFDRFSFLTNGTNQAAFSPGMKSINVHSPMLPAHGLDTTPFSMDIMGQDEALSPHRMMAMCDDGSMYNRAIGEELVDGIGVFSIEFGERGRKPVFKYSFDPNWGYLPRFVVLPNQDSGKITTEVVVTDARACGNGRWFPMRSVRILVPDSGAGVGVREIKVTELDTDKRPNADAFSIVLPAGTAVMNPADRIKTFKLKQQEVIRPADIATLLTMCAETEEPKPGSRRPRDTSVPRASSSAPYYWFGGAIIAVVAATVIIGRRGRRAGRT